MLLAVAVVWKGAVWLRLSYDDSFAARPAPPSPLQVGDSLTLPGIDWGLADRSVVLLVSTACPACDQSATFYSGLSADIARLDDVQLVLAGTDPISVSSAWATSRSIAYDLIIHVDDPVGLGFIVTPTVLIVDPLGEITDIAVRQLTSRLEREVLRRVHGGPTAERVDNLRLPEEIAAADLPRRAGGRPITLLNIDARGARGRVLGDSWRRIPAEELATRAPHELDSASLVAIDCAGQVPSTCRAAAWTLQDLGFQDVVQLMDRAR